MTLLHDVLAAEDGKQGRVSLAGFLGCKADGTGRHRRTPGGWNDVGGYDRCTRRSTVAEWL